MIYIKLTSDNRVAAWQLTGKNLGADAIQVNACEELMTYEGATTDFRYHEGCFVFDPVTEVPDMTNNTAARLDNIEAALIELAAMIGGGV